MNFYSASQSRALDQLAIAQGTPGLLLMKRAAFFAFETLEKLWPKAKRVCIICGSGNNGGDGFALAQYLAVAGFEVEILMTNEPATLAGDALLCYQETLALGLTPQAFQTELLINSDLIVDAMFGTGLNKAITGVYTHIIESINTSQKPILALDIPSGLNADTGAILGMAVQAQHTCCFIAPKIGLYTFQGPECAGKIHFSRLGLSDELYQSFTPVAVTHPIKFWLNQLPKFKPTSHKGSRGTCCLIGGNHHMMGAIQLAGLACLKSGAGLVKIITQKAHCLPITQALPEAMAYEISQLKTVLLSSRALAIGPGVGQDAWANDLLQNILPLPHPKVLDADALNILATGQLDLSQAKRNWILTPHPAEAARLLDITTEQVQQNRVQAIKDLHNRYGGVIVLKGNGTLVFDGQYLELCVSGNAGMAVGGMGDVLTGIMVSFLGQGVPLFETACLAVALHAQAGDVLANQISQAGVTPSELAKTISQLLSYAN